MLVTWWCMHFQNISFTTRKSSSCVYCMPQAECPLTKNMPLLSKRYLPLVSVHETKNWHVKHTEKKMTRAKQKLKIIIMKTFFPGMKSNQKCTTKLGESDQGNLSGEGLSASVKIKSLFWTCSCSLPIETPDSFPKHVTSRAMRQTTIFSPFPKY